MMSQRKAIVSGSEAVSTYDIQDSDEKGEQQPGHMQPVQQQQQQQ
jgi:hypothetical protein